MLKIRDLTVLGIKSKGKTPSKEALRQIEERVGVELPADYIEFVKQVNGGFVENAKHPKVPLLDSFLFYKIAEPSEGFDYMSEREQADVVDSFSGHPVIAIGGVDNGDNVVLSHDDKQWRVMLWCHESGELIETVSDSFTNFINDLII